MLRATGTTLIAAGALVLLFVAYQLWGTGLHEARAQDDLRRDFEATLDAQPARTPTTSGPGPTTSTTATSLPPAVPGEAVAVIRVPRIGLSKAVVEGVGVSDLRKGPGHYPQTPLPGQPGNAAIAGHRTTYGAPFWDLDELTAGDEIEVTTRQGTFTFVVDGTRIVRPDQVEVLAPTREARLTLTTCHPRFSRRQRLVVTGVLRADTEPAPRPPTTTTTAPPAGSPEPAAARPAPDPGLGGDRSARGPAALWSAAAAAAALATWLMARRLASWRRWAVVAAGAVPFFVLLFVAFEQIARLLPADF